MPLLEGNKVSFQYDKQSSNLLNEVSFFINKKAKVGLIGKNGSGKSTLFKLILGQLKEHKGVISKVTPIKIAYLLQELEIDESFTVEDYLFLSNPSLFKVKRNLSTLDINDKNYLYLLSDYEEFGGYKLEAQIRKLIEQFQLNDSFLKRILQNLSGGEKTKISLIQILLTRPDLILFDEPTNHLDLITLQWLESYLKNLIIPFIIISHDRTFLDNCTTEIWELKSSQLRSFSGNYSFYRETIRKEYERMKLNYDQQQKKIKQLTQAAKKRRIAANRMENFKPTRSIKKNGGICKRDDGSGSWKANPTKQMKAAKALEKRIELMIQKEKAKRPFLAKKNPIIFSSKNSRSRIVAQITSLSKSYSQKLFENLSISVENGQKLGLVGKNGTGKTTLLKILVGLEKADSGFISIPPSITLSYYAQDYKNLNLRNCILNEVIGTNKEKETFTRILLGCLEIKNDKVFQKIGTLSIGERRKISLLKTILSGANLLILDEPTNHLDIDLKETIEDALKEYNGSVLFASHDRKFIEEIADNLFDLESKFYLDTFSDYVMTLNKK